jgi:hypothetical protein
MKQKKQNQILLLRFQKWIVNLLKILKIIIQIKKHIKFKKKLSQLKILILAVKIKKLFHLKNNQSINKFHHLIKKIMMHLSNF